MNCKFFTIGFWIWVFLHALPGRAQAQSCQPLRDWEFHPHHTLAGHAENYPGMQVVQINLFCINPFAIDIGIASGGS